MKVYVITAGEYSEYHIERVFLDREKARVYANINDFMVEEYEISDKNVKIDEDYQLYKHYQYRVGSENDIEIYDTHRYISEPMFTMHKALFCDCAGDIAIKCKKGEEISEQQVKKLIAEKVAKKKAELLGL